MKKVETDDFEYSEEYQESAEADAGIIIIAIFLIICLAMFVSFGFGLLVLAGIVIFANWLGGWGDYKNRDDI